MGEYISGEQTYRRSRLVQVGDTPAAGADWSVKVPGGHAWRLISVYAQLVTAAAVADRQVNLVLNDNIADFLVLPPVAVQAASLTNTYSWVEHGNQAQVGTVQALELPEVILPAGWTVKVSTTNLQAADQWTAPRLLVLDATVRSGPIDLEQAAAITVVVMGESAS